MAVSEIQYGTSTAVTFGVASLASDTNLLAGRASAAVDNTSTKAVDYQIYFKATLGAAPTADRQIELWLAGSEDGTNFAGGNGGSDANKTHTVYSKAAMTLLKVLPTGSAASGVVEWTCNSLQALIGNIPRKFSVFGVHNTGQAFAASGHALTVTPVKFTST